MNNTTDDVAPMSRGHVLRGINSKHRDLEMGWPARGSTTYCCWITNNPEVERSRLPLAQYWRPKSLWREQKGPRLPPLQTSLFASFRLIR